MTDETTPHGAALSLLRMIATSEGKILDFNSASGGATREWLIWTYAQCLQTGLEPQDAKGILEWPIPKESSK